MNNIKEINKGFINFDDKVIISDPCYGMNTWCQGIVDNVLKGKYKCMLETSDEGEWGNRISAIQVVHEYYVKKSLEYSKENFVVGVDSGQAGIFDYEYYKKYHSDASESEHINEDWYWRVCDLTTTRIKNPNYEKFDYEKHKDDFFEAPEKYMNSNKACPYLTMCDGNTIDNLGFVSSSGYGDGGYDCWTAHNDEGKIVAIRVEYITEEDEEED